MRSLNRVVPLALWQARRRDQGCRLEVSLSSISLIHLDRKQQQQQQQQQCFGIPIQRQTTCMHTCMLQHTLNNLYAKRKGANSLPSIHLSFLSSVPFLSFLLLFLLPLFLISRLFLPSLLQRFLLPSFSAGARTSLGAPRRRPRPSPRATRVRGRGCTWARDAADTDAHSPCRAASGRCAHAVGEVGGQLEAHW